MQYDGLDRLTYAHLHWWSIDNFTYDVLDNIRGKSHFNGATTVNHDYWYDATNRLTNVKDADTGASLIGLGYDTQGNLANKNGTVYTFDSGNRLRGVTGLETYRYDGHGRRVLNWRPSGTLTLSMYSHAGQLLYQENSSRQVVIEHIYLQGSLVATRDRPYSSPTPAVHYRHTDALGSPVAMTNAAGQVIDRTQYAPYGESINATTDGVGYTGHVEDAATGLVYMQQRYYDPGIGRMLSVDPVTAYEQPITNFCRYCYANNNPYRFIDPDGRVSDDPDRQHRGVKTPQPSPAADKVNYDKGGAPTGKIAAQMRSENPSDRTAMAKTAMAVADINGNENNLAYNENLRGQASATTDPSGHVEVGPDAFSSWSWLTSTLGHEFEVHAPQMENFGPIEGRLDNDLREIEAHQYNIDNATRFRNTPGEIQRHLEWRDAYQYRAEGGQ